MKLFRNLQKESSLILFIFLISFFFRIVLLNKFPIGITHDELNYVFSAKSLFLTGRFLPGTAPLVFHTNMNNISVVIADMPAILLSVFTGALKFSLFNARFVGALLSSLTVILIYFIVRILFNNRKYAFFAGILLAINPWSLLLGRTIFEVNFYIFFFFLGLLILLRQKNWRIFYSLPFYLLGFFSYTGGQVVFLLFSLLSLVFHHFYFSKKITKPYFVYSAILLLVFSSYLVVSLRGKAMALRSGELYLPTSSSVIEEVNKERLISRNSSFSTLFVNKATIFTQGFLEKYFGAFSPSVMFLNGELRAAYSYQVHGMFYIYDSILIALGILVIFYKKRNIWLFLISLILIAPITSGLSTVEYSYSQRAAFMYPILVIFSAGGLLYLVELLRIVKFRRLIYPLMFAIFILSFINLVYIYFFRFPVFASDGWFFQDRILSRYIQLASSEGMKDIYIFSSEPRIIFEEYLFYTNLYNKFSADRINTNINDNEYVLGDVHFVNNCYEQSINPDSVKIYDVLLNCTGNKNNLLRITRFQDVAEKYLIENDSLCEDKSLRNYVQQSAYNNFAVESQSIDDFCTNWLTKI